jgi:hypothetical protein
VQVWGTAVIDFVAAITNAVSTVLNISNAYRRRSEQPDRVVYRILVSLFSGAVGVVYLLKLFNILPSPLPIELLETLLALGSLVPLVIGIVELPRKK